MAVVPGTSTVLIGVARTVELRALEDSRLSRVVRGVKQQFFCKMEKREMRKLSVMGYTTSIIVY
jgi:hypothetical protein